MTLQPFKACGKYSRSMLFMNIFSIAAMYSDHSDLIVIGGKSGGLDIKENCVFPEFPVCPPVLLFGQVIGKVCVDGHLAYFLIY